MPLMVPIIGIDIIIIREDPAGDSSFGSSVISSVGVSSFGSSVISSVGVSPFGSSLSSTTGVVSVKTGVSSASPSLVSVGVSLLSVSAPVGFSCVTVDVSSVPFSIFGEALASAVEVSVTSFLLRPDSKFFKEAPSIFEFGALGVVCGETVTFPLT